MTQQRQAKKLDPMSAFIQLQGLANTTEMIEKMFAQATDILPELEPVREEIQNAHGHLLSALESLEIALETD
jgi:hypothetical protein